MNIYILLWLMLLCVADQRNACAQTRNLNEKFIFSNLNSYSSHLKNNTLQNSNILSTNIKRDYIEIIEDKNKKLISELENKKFLFDADLYPFTNRVFLEILSKNNLEKERFHFFINRSAEINAYAYEDGTIVCNLGLLNIIETESQLAYIFCHEIAHYLLQHGNTLIIKQLEKYYSKEFLTEIRKIKNSKYNSKSKLEKIFLDDVFNVKKHNRSQETAADSLAIHLFKNTNYSGKDIPRVFDLLEEKEDFFEKDLIQNFFNETQIELNTEWLGSEKKMKFGEVKKNIIDSLKTHPDCEKRKLVVQEYFDNNHKDGDAFHITDYKKLVQLKKQAYLEQAQYSKEIENLGYYFFQLLKYKAIYGSDVFSNKEIFNTLVSFCNFQKSHTLYKIVTTPYNYGSNRTEYNKLLEIMDVIPLENLIELTKKHYYNNENELKKDCSINQILTQ